MKPRKCSLFKRKVKFLGRIVSGDGYRIGPGCVQAIEKLKEVKLLVKLASCWNLKLLPKVH